MKYNHEIRLIFLVESCFLAYLCFRLVWTGLDYDTSNIVSYLMPNLFLYI